MQTDVYTQVDMCYMEIFLSTTNTDTFMVHTHSYTLTPHTRTEGSCVCVCVSCVVGLLTFSTHCPPLCLVVFSFTSSLGVGYLMVCTESYPNVLAFCFLDELQREFIVTYDTKRINSAVRPYSFIEFGKQTNVNPNVHFHQWTN